MSSPRPSYGPRRHASSGRALAVGHLRVCHHEAVLNVDRYGDAVPAPAFGRRIVYLVRNHRRPDRFGKNVPRKRAGPAGSGIEAPSTPAAVPLAVS